MINLGVGYGSSEKAILSAGISEDNVFGSGTNLTLQLNTSKSNRAVVLSHTDPYWTKDGISRTTSAYYRVTEPWNNNDGDYRVKAMGLGMNFGVPISEYDRIFLGANFERNQIDLYNNSPLAYKNFVNQYGDSTNSVIFSAGWSRIRATARWRPVDRGPQVLHADGPAAILRAAGRCLHAGLERHG